MNNLYSISVLLVIGWLCGCFLNSAGGTFHALAIIAAIAILPGTFCDRSKKASYSEPLVSSAQTEPAV